MSATISFIEATPPGRDDVNLAARRRDKLGISRAVHAAEHAVARNVGVNQRFQARRGKRLRKPQVLVAARLAATLQPALEHDRAAFCVDADGYSVAVFFYHLFGERAVFHRRRAQNHAAHAHAEITLYGLLRPDPAADFHL